MGYVLLGLGLVFVLEGLVIALAPSRMEDMLKALSEIPPETRRLMGLVAIALGTLLVWVAKSAFG